MIILLSILFFRNSISGKMTFVYFKKKEVSYYLFFMFIAFLMGSLHIEGSFLSYGTTELKRTLISFSPIFYLLLISFITINFINSKKEFDQTLKFIWILTILLVMYGFVR
ncbi:MAG: hypothetical protein ACE5JB_03320, partial [bacterium]